LIHITAEVAEVACTRKSRASEFPLWMDFGTGNRTSPLACSHCWLEPSWEYVSASKAIGLKTSSSWVLSWSCLRLALYGRLLCTYFSSGLRLNPQNLGWHWLWSPNWWGMRAWTFSLSSRGFPWFLAKQYFEHFCKCVIVFLISFLFLLWWIPYSVLSMFFTTWFLLNFFCTVMFRSLLRRDIKVLSPSPSIISMGVQLFFSSLTPFTPLLLSIDLALPLWLKTHLCLQTFSNGRFFFHHLQVPHGNDRSNNFLPVILRTHEEYVSWRNILKIYKLTIKASIHVRTNYLLLKHLHRNTKPTEIVTSKWQHIWGYPKITMLNRTTVFSKLNHKWKKKKTILFIVVLRGPTHFIFFKHEDNLQDLQIRLSNPRLFQAVSTAHVIPVSVLHGYFDIRQICFLLLPPSVCFTGRLKA